MLYLFEIIFNYLRLANPVAYCQAFVFPKWKGVKFFQSIKNAPAKKDWRVKRTIYFKKRKPQSILGNFLRTK